MVNESKSLSVLIELQDSIIKKYFISPIQIMSTILGYFGLLGSGVVISFKATL